MVMAIMVTFVRFVSIGTAMGAMASVLMTAMLFPVMAVLSLMPFISVMPFLIRTFHTVTGIIRSCLGHVAFAAPEMRLMLTTSESFRTLTAPEITSFTAAKIIALSKGAEFGTLLPVTDDS